MNTEYVNGGGMWLAIALINAGLAEQKNRSRMAWFFISLFFGPFATFLIVAFPAPLTADEPPPRRRASEERPRMP